MASPSRKKLVVRAAPTSTQAALTPAAVQEKGQTDFVVVHIVCATGLLSDGPGDVFCTLKSVSAEDGGQVEKKQSKQNASGVR